MINNNTQKQLQYLIQCSDDIIDHHHFDFIDGENNIAVLSHKLYTLNKRYDSLLQQMWRDQLKLKEYIEDISHQLKTPITSMRINEELLLEAIDSSQQKKQLEALYIQTLKMDHLVNDLLTLALIDSHSISFKFQDHMIETLINDVEEDLDYLLRQKRMTIQLHHHQEKLLCDKKWFEEALKNIIKNYIEKNQNGTIDITIKTTDTLTHISIQDHGVGFPQEDLPHLFERFYRGQKSDYQGIGIGLSLSKAIIEQHHGTIQASNHHGALIDIIIPKFLAKKKL